MTERLKRNTLFLSIINKNFMMKNFRPGYLLLLLISWSTQDGFTQTNGDFQTKNSTGNWSDFNAWNRHNGTSWIAATSGQLPGLGSNVFVQAGHTINVDNSNAVCKDLNVNGDDFSKIAFSTMTGTLNVRRDMFLFSKSHNCFETWAAGAKIVFSGSQNQAFTNLSANTVFLNIEVNKSSGSLNISSSVLSIEGNLTLTSGTLNIGANGTLIMNGPMVSTSGILDGTNSSDISFTGTTGGSVLLPVTGNISLRNVAISGNRTLIMDGTHHINLNGIFSISKDATYDNGGESQITNSGGSIVINGKFINRDRDDFCGTNGAITKSFNPLLNPECTIEFALGGNQTFTARNDFKNITFSGSGTKTPSSSFTPAGIFYITGNAIVDASNHNIGDGSTVTNFTMDGGRLILGTTGTQPMMGGIYNLTGGIIQFNGSNAQTIRSKSYQNIEVTGAGVGNSNGNITLNSKGTFTVKNNGIFVVNDNNITGADNDGTQSVTIENGGIFRCGNNKGFNGFNAQLINNSSISSNILNINLNEGSTVEYMRGGDQPITNSNALIYSNLILNGSGNKKAPGILTVQGNLINAGSCTFDHNEGTVVLNGANQTFAGLTYNNLILINDTKTTSGSSIIIDSIKINDGTSLSINNGDVITLHSDETKTARVGQISTGTINYNTSGKFIVERYIPAKKAWRFLSVPISNSTQTIKQAWQEGATLYSSDPKTGYGIQITSDNSGWFALGFDALSYGPSVKTYNPASDTYSGLTSTNIPFDATKGGYMTFIRGDRSATSVVSAVTSTTLRTEGKLFTGNQVPINLIPGQFTPVNNPYASPLDLRNLSRSSSIFYYVWDPNRGGNYGFGGFSTLSWDGSTDYDAVPANAGSYGSINNYIASGQAFFVSGTGGSIQITENAKTSATVSIIPFTPIGIPSQKLRSNLYSINTDGSTSLADGVLTSFGNNYSNKVDEMDARKMMNYSENLSLKREGHNLAIERRHSIQSTDTLFFSLDGIRKQQYRFEFIASQLSQTGLEAYIEDNYLKTRTLLNFIDTTLLDFVIDNKAASAAPGRFQIVFGTSSGLLPVTFTNVKAYPKNGNIAIEWNVENETEIKYYEVEKSFNETLFIPTAVIIANDKPVGSSYNWIDVQPHAGYNYYRIKSTGTDGKIQYSKTVKSRLVNNNDGISIYPNPLSNGIIHIHFNNQMEGKYLLRLMNASGQVIESTVIEYISGNSNTGTISFKKNIAHGLYRLNIMQPDNSELSVNILY